MRQGLGRAPTTSRLLVIHGTHMASHIVLNMLNQWTVVQKLTSQKYKMLFGSEPTM